MSTLQAEIVLRRLTEADQHHLTTILHPLPSSWQEVLLNALIKVDTPTIQEWLETNKLQEWVQQGRQILAHQSQRSKQHATDFFTATPLVLPVLSAEELGEWVRLGLNLEGAGSSEVFSFLPDGLGDLEAAERLSCYRLAQTATRHSLSAAAVIYRSLPRTCQMLSSELRKPLLRCVQATVTFDSRLLPALLPLLGPTLRNLPPESGVSLLQRIAQLARIFPAGILELFRTLGQVYDEVGEEKTLGWIAVGEEIASRNPQAGEAFFALKSRTSLLTLQGASSAVVLTDIQGILVKFLHMLSGTAVALAEADSLSLPPPLAEEESELVPLPYSIDMFPTYEENFRLYRVLAAHQAGRLEFGTYTCSPSDLWPSLPPFVHTLVSAEAALPGNLASYFRLFPRPDLIEDLFLYIEGKRITARLALTYAGLRADQTWAESFSGLLSSAPPTLLSYLPDSVWVDLGSIGTASDSLRLATELYVEFLQAEQGLTSESLPFPQPEGLIDVAKEPIAFLSGLEEGERRGSPALSTRERSTRQRRTQVTPGLHYVYDEWDYEIEDYRAHWCQLREIPLLGDEGAFFANTLTTYADITPDIKREFERLRPRLYRQVKGREEGEEIDLDAAVVARVDRLTGVSPSPKLYMARQPVERDVAVLLLLDLSASTAARLATEVSAQTPLVGHRILRVIDVLKEAVVLLATALEEIGDAYAIYGFSSNSRHDVKVYPAKTFNESLSSEVKGRIGALTPQGSTRMGTAVRHAARKLKDLTSRAKMLLLLSDGYPEDEGYGKPVVPPTYGLRDTMMALREAERSGIVSFCLTVDKGGHDYLREMCAPLRYMVIEDILSLPTELPKIYQRYIWSQWF